MGVVLGLVFSAGVLFTGTAQEVEGLSDGIKAALQTESYIYVATQRLNGEWSTPAPVWFMSDGDAIYFTTSPTSHKALRIHRGSPVRIWVGRKDGPLLEGEARFIKDRATIERMAERYAQKYWIARLGFFKPRPGRVAAGKTLAVQVFPLRSAPEN
jgi:general stress protein 26